MEKFEQVASKISNDIEGWLAYEAAIYTLELLKFQNLSSFTGSLLEMGVHKGKYFSVLKYGSSEKQKLIGVDAFFERIGVPLEERWKNLAIENIKNNLIHIWGDSDNTEILAGLTSSFNAKDLITKTGSKYKFISVDAGHDAKNVRQDLILAAEIMTDDGVIAADDIFNPSVPEVTQGFFEWAMLDSGSSDLAPFAYCANKLFLAKRDAHEKYHRFSSELVQSSSQNSIFDFARAHIIDNEKNNYQPLFLGSKYLRLTA